MSYLVSAKIRASGTAIMAFDAEDAAMQVKALLRRGARSVEITNDGNDGATDPEDAEIAADRH